MANVQQDVVVKQTSLGDQGSSRNCLPWLGQLEPAVLISDWHDKVNGGAEAHILTQTTSYIFNNSHSNISNNIHWEQQPPCYEDKKGCRELSLLIVKLVID